MYNKPINKYQQHVLHNDRDGIPAGNEEGGKGIANKVKEQSTNDGCKHLRVNHTYYQICYRTHLCHELLIEFQIINYKLRPNVVRSRVRNTAFMDASCSGSPMATTTVQSFSRTILDPTEARLARVARVMTTAEMMLTAVSGLPNRPLNQL